MGRFYILPFYSIFRSASAGRWVYGILMIIVFFACYVLAFKSKGWVVYFWTSVQIVVSITMTLLFGYMYFALFLAFSSEISRNGLLSSPCIRFIC